METGFGKSCHLFPSLPPAGEGKVGSSSHQAMRRSRGCGHTSAVQSGPESSESEISEYSDDRFLSSGFTLVKNPAKTKEERKRESQWKLMNRVGPKVRPASARVSTAPALSISTAFLFFIPFFPRRLFSQIDQDTDWTVLLKRLWHLLNKMIHSSFAWKFSISFQKKTSNTEIGYKMLFTFPLAFFPPNRKQKDNSPKPQKHSSRQWIQQAYKPGLITALLSHVALPSNNCLVSPVMSSLSPGTWHMQGHQLQQYQIYLELARTVVFNTDETFIFLVKLSRYLTTF